MGQPKDKEEYEKNHALLINETGLTRFSIFTLATSTRGPLVVTNEQNVTIWKYWWIPFFCLSCSCRLLFRIFDRRVQAEEKTEIYQSLILAFLQKYILSS